MGALRRRGGGVSGTPATHRPVSRLRWTAAGVEAGRRQAPEEAAVALVFDGGTEAVMMATPADFEDFAMGFALTEGVIAAPAEVVSIETVEQPLGFEVRMFLRGEVGGALARRRRTRAGPVGCGLCGVDSLEAALPALSPVASDLRVTPEDIVEAMRALAAGQPLFAATRAVHAAAWFRPGQAIALVREDVGRHNALDKVAGALARAGIDAGQGVLLLTSRLSVDLVQKAARIGAPVLACVSAPTALSLRAAEAAGITVAAIVRDDGLEVFSHPRRLGLAAPGAVGEEEDHDLRALR
jgi:FdhD protein